MEETITINMSKKDKELVKIFANEQRLRTASFCRFVIMKYIKENQEEAQ